ncbi:ATP-binding protein [Phaeocystidibacter luteus]|uniref:ATP-binding protein n=1 Tax=Phaeocystidibacter luteus TaxID=911197 RepID=A0A6N6RCU6_9FLAO|nr:ATP-binding protein [Phaeocystidibacter luteus]KAB2805311.1 ATP-binding protein [Phaeocystidibacter luteus]
MSKKYRLTLILLATLSLIVVGYINTSNYDFLINDFWFTSGALLLILLSLVDQPHFSKDSNIFINAVTAGISLLLVEQDNRDYLFWVFFGLTIYLLTSSYILLWIRQKALADENKFVKLFSRLNRQLGRPESIFSAFFIWGAYKQFGAETNQFNSLLIFWIVFIILNIPSLAKAIEDLLYIQKEKNNQLALGQIFGVQSKNTFLVKLFDTKDRITQARIFDFVEFKYSTDEKLRKGLLIDTYLLKQEQWVKILSNSEIEKIFNNAIIHSNHSPDIVYRIEDIPENDYLNRLVGIITENTVISKIRFVYNSRMEIQEGQLLEVTVQKQQVLYQVVEGITRIEQLEQKNQTGLIVGEAIQLGTWNAEKCQFEQFGWVPEINSPVYIADDIEIPEIKDEEYIIGSIPGTNYPVIIDKNVAITHHTAIIGVTGTGKSIFARNLIRQYLSDDDTKVICIDFTGEYLGKFSDYQPDRVISDEKSESLFKKIDKIERIVANNYNKDNEESRLLRKEIAEEMYNEISNFLKGNKKLSIFELPHVENTSGVLTYTKTFFRLLFHIAKKEKSYGKRICIVLEEAHTIVPEWNFSGVSDKVSQPLLNSIAQIALQGRKYNVGLMVIAQRTANVSKTILTQCNTIVSFQEFDKTSSDFLSNYFGQEIVGSLNKLKFRQAIAAGKAFKSNVPMIFEVPHIEEPEFKEAAEVEAKEEPLKEKK